MPMALEIALPLATISPASMWWRAMPIAVLAPSKSMQMSWCGEALIALVSMPRRAYAPAPDLNWCDVYIRASAICLLLAHVVHGVELLGQVVHGAVHAA